MGYLVYRVVTSADSLPLAFVAGNCVTSLLRILVTLLVLHEPVSRGVWAGFFLVFLAQFVKQWR